MQVSGRLLESIDESGSWMIRLDVVVFLPFPCSVHHIENQKLCFSDLMGLPL